MQSQHHMLPLVVDGASYVLKGKAIIEDVSFTIQDAGLTALLGPNGAGKSTLLKLCHGLLPLSSGSIRWGGADVHEVQQKQAMVFQRPVLLRRSAAENVDHVLKLRGASAAERARVIEESLEWAGLADIADTPARKLSGGEQQSLTIARAWALNPEVLLLDEPTANLDPAATTVHLRGLAKKSSWRRTILRRRSASPMRSCSSITAACSSTRPQSSS
jgi:tungstate transport system ATP-binding protein